MIFFLTITLYGCGSQSLVDNQQFGELKKILKNLYFSCVIP